MERSGSGKTSRGVRRNEKEHSVHSSHSTWPTNIILQPAIFPLFGGNGRSSAPRCRLMIGPSYLIKYADWLDADECIRLITRGLNGPLRF